MEINKLNSNVVDRGVLETQDNSATSQAMMQGGRRIQQQDAIVPVFQQMAITPGASQRTIITHTVTAEHACCATTETANAGNPESPEMAVQSGYSGLTRGFIHMVDIVYHRLSESMKTDWNKNPDALPFCLSVATEIQILIHRKEVNHVCYRLLVKNKIGLLYAQSLNPALQILQNRAIAGRSWEHYEEMLLLARCLEFYSTNENEAADKAMLAQVYQQFVDSELHYLDRMKDSVLQYPCDHSFHIIDTLLSDDSPACRLKILEDDCIAKSREKVEKLRKHRSSLSAMQEGGADRIQKEIKELKEKIHNGTNDMMIKRTYHEVLVQRIERVGQEWQKAPGQVSDQQFVDFITELADCCEEQSLFLMEFTRLHNDLKSLLCYIGSQILVIIKDRPGNVDYLRNNAMHVISRLNKLNWLNEECRNLYIYCTKPQPAVRTNKITDLRCQQKLGEIISFIHHETRPAALEAASRLQQFLDEYENEMNLLCTANSLNRMKDSLIKTLYKQLFTDFFIEWDQHFANKLSYEEIDNKMSRHYSAFVDLIPYAPLLLKDSGMQFWQKIACAVWANHIQDMGNKASFGEDDVDMLLNLNDIVPNITNGRVRSRLKYSLEQLFRFVLETDNHAGISVDKLARLSEWSDYLIQNHPDHNWHSLPMLTEAWKHKQCNATSKRNMTSSDTPEKTTPVPTHPGLHVANRFTEVPDDPFCTRQQVVFSPVMQPLTAHHHTPTPAASWFCQQPAAACYSPANQSPMAAGPYSTPIQQFQPAPYGLPAPAASWSCQQPAAICHSPANQSPMATGPYPTPIQQFQTAPYGMPAPAAPWPCQQPATVIHASPATQAPMAAGPYPTPIRQFQPAPYGTLTGSQLPMPAMMSHFPAHPHVQVCPSCQFTACEPVQSQEQIATQQQYLFQQPHLNTSQSIQGTSDQVMTQHLATWEHTLI